MAKFQFKGVDELVSQYEKLANDSQKIMGEAIYYGADVVMKHIRSAVQGIATDNHFGTAENPCIGPSTYAKEGLIQSLGITPARYDGSFYNVKIGFDGYNGIKTKTWPSGQPNSMIARSVESGTSWMQKQPFMRQAEQSARGPCEKVMAEVVDKAIEKIVK